MERQNTLPEDRKISKQQTRTNQNKNSANVDVICINVPYLGTQRDQL